MGCGSARDACSASLRFADCIVRLGSRRPLRSATPAASRVTAALARVPGGGEAGAWVEAGPRRRTYVGRGGVSPSCEGSPPGLTGGEPREAGSSTRIRVPLFRRAGRGQPFVRGFALWSDRELTPRSGVEHTDTALQPGGANAPSSPPAGTRVSAPIRDAAGVAPMSWPSGAGVGRYAPTGTQPNPRPQALLVDEQNAGKLLDQAYEV